MMKKRILPLVLAITLIFALVPAVALATTSDVINFPDPNLNSAFGPVYATKPIYDDDGLTDDTTYYFLTGTIDVPYGRTLLMVNGQFIPHLVEIRDDRALIPLRFVTQAFGASVEWDEQTKTVTMQLDDTMAEVTIGERFAEVSKDGEKMSHDLYTAAIIIDGHTYVPVRALSEIFDKEAGFEPRGPRKLAENPIVWIDNKYEWEPDIEAIRADSMKALELLRENFYTMIDGMFADTSVESNEAQLAAIEEIINNMSVTGFIGRYAVINGPYTILACPYSDDVFFNRAVYLMWGIQKADFNDPGTYLPNFFLG